MTTTPGPPPASPAPRRRSRWRWLWLLFGVPLFVVLLLGGALAWLAGTDGGTRWLLAQAQQRVPGLQIDGAHGRLLGDFDAQRVQYDADGTQVVVTALAWRGLRLHDIQWQVPWLQVHAQSLTAEDVRVTLPATLADAPDTGLTPPPSLVLPVGVAIDQIHVGSLHLPGQPHPLQALQASLKAGSTHRLDDLSLNWRGVLIEGMAEMAAGGAFDTVVRLAARTDPAARRNAAPDASRPGAEALVPAWAEQAQLNLDASGPLARLAVRLSLQLQSQVLEATADVTPFEAQPLARLDARFERLDLAVLLAPFDAPAPVTELTGEATVRLDAGEPLGVSVELSNAVPGPWDAGRLPLQRLTLRARGEGQRWDVQDSRWEAANGAGQAVGVLDLSGRYEPGRLEVRLDLNHLMLGALDTRLPPMRLGGPLQVVLELPVPAGDATAPPFRSAQFEADLSGALTEGPAAKAPAVQLRLQGGATPNSVTIQEWHAQAGDARLEGRLAAQMDAGRWRADAELAFRRFNPALWLPADPDRAWRNGRHAFSGNFRLEALLPQTPEDIKAWLHEFDGTLALRLEDSRGAADGRGLGALDLSGRYKPGRLEARLDLNQLMLGALDARLPPMRLGGPLQLVLELPVPAAADVAAGDTTAAPFRSVQFDADLTGALTQGPAAKAPAVQLRLRGGATPDSVTIQQWHAQAGDARLEGRLAAKMDAGRWRADAELAFRRFNPALWLPADPDSAWRHGRHALSGDLRLKALLPTAPEDIKAWLHEFDGTLAVRLEDSLLLDQPLDLDVDIAADGAGGLRLRTELLATGNSARVDTELHMAPDPGRGSPARTPARDRVALTVQAPALHRLAPLTEWLGQGPLRGAFAIDATAEGPIGAWLERVITEGAGKREAAALTWPLFTTEGRANASQVSFGELRLDDLQATWRADLRGAAQLDARVQLKQLRAPGVHVPQANLQAAGTLDEHTVAIEADLQQASAPPRTGDAATGVTANADAGTAKEASTAQTTRRAAFRASASGKLTLPDASATPPQDAVAWDGRIDELLLRLPLVKDLPPLLSASKLPLRLRVAPGGLDAELMPGQMRVLDAPLRWSQASWSQRAAEDPRLILKAEVEPVAVAPWLRRFQPDFGWDGDLRLGARIDLTATPAVTADVVLSRAGGDLQVREGDLVQPLGLTAFELRYQAQQGQWRMTQRIVGQNLGRIEGTQSVRTDPTSWWPRDDASVEGDLTVRVEQLAAWGVWVPAGWRLGGQLQAQMRLSGRFGSPELTGDVRGERLTARNAIEGVALTDGELRIDLQGDSATVQRLRFAAGEGQIEITGSARLGDDPRAELRLLAERFTVLGRVDRRVVVSGSGDVVLDRERLSVKGRLQADEGLIDITRADAPRLSGDVTVRRPGQPDPSTQATQVDGRTAGAPERNTVLDLVFDPGKNFRLRGRGIDTRLTGELRLTTPRGRLAGNGEIRTDRGTYEAYGQRLDIERGVLTFVGDLDNPRLDIVAVRARTETRVGVVVSGSALSPRVRLFSDPEMPDTEKLALLITGRSADNLGGAETVMLQRAALALLAGDSDGGGPGSLPGRLGLDDFSVRQTDGVVQDTVVAVGKQVSDRIYVGYERGLNATTGSWQIIYRIAQRFTLRAQSGDDSALDLIWVFNWD